MSTNASLAARRGAAIPAGLSKHLDVYIDRAENAELWDIEGRRYIDFAAGIAVNNTGHRHPKVVERVRRQLDKVTHTSFQTTPYEDYVTLCEKLNALLPGDFPKKTFLVSTGAEAIENAAKIARVATGRSAFVAFSGGFHGRTLMAMTLTGKTAPYKVGFGPLVPDVYHLPFPIAYHGIGEDEALKALDRLFKSEVDPSRVAGIFVEPVQGEGGFYPAPATFLRALREICDKHGILLIFDEVITGFGRLGTPFAADYFGVTPDIITTAKGVSNGVVPMGAVFVKKEIHDAFMNGPEHLIEFFHGYTYSGNPIACAAALGTLDTYKEEGLLTRGAELAPYWEDALHSLKGEPNDIDVRNIGLIGAIELQPIAGQPTKRAFSAFVKAFERGALIRTTGDIIALSPPLIITKGQINELIDHVREVLRLID
ncbi:aspartate aminotransferase family protein [Rhizobiaceae sp. 2RAB30]